MPKQKRQRIRDDWPKIVRVSVRGETRFKVDGRPHKERVFFREKNDALVQADVWAQERENQGLEALQFPTTLRMEATEAARLLQPFRKSLVEAATHYVAYLQDERRKQEANSVQACLNEWIRVKRAEAKTGIIARRTIQELESRVRLFGRAFSSLRIPEIDEDGVKTFLDSLPVSQLSKQSVRTKLVQFFNFCRLKKWTTHNPAEAIKIKVPVGEVTILSPEQAEALLIAAKKYSESESLVPYVAISLFAGLRPGEAEQLCWERIRTESDQIEVRGETSKTRETRFVRIEPTLRSWLTPHLHKKGVIIGPNFRKHWEAVRRVAGFKFQRDEQGVPWPPDVMRHSFGSYWLAKYADRPRLAEEMGNSVGVIKAHYKRAIPLRIAEKFWGIQPKGI